MCNLYREAVNDGQQRALAVELFASLNLSKGFAGNDYNDERVR